MRSATRGIWAVGCVLVAGAAWSHCDTMSGPVVTTAKAVLEKGDVTPVLKWVKPEIEQEIRAAFDKTLTVRKQSAEARELADMYFFETLVRLHRAGEGAPYTGLKPAGTDLGPAVEGADRAIEGGSVDHLVALITNAVTDGLRHRFERVIATKKHADESVEAGREFVEAYVLFVHYAERLYTDATSEATQHGEGEQAEAAGHPAGEGE